ncbi:MAG: hypothetical protein CSA62_08785 [Planctomycetota bacterium]|nr:MAG: hypothetical protein CSA62_08785 [Planctomycetota bacterium]
MARDLWGWSCYLAAMIQSQILRYSLLLLLTLSLGLTTGCSTQGSSDQFGWVNLTVFDAARARKIDDVLVWPTRNSGAEFRSEELDRFRKALRRSLISARYSVLSDRLVCDKAGAEARIAAPDRNREGTVARAVSVVGELGADAVLLLWLEEFDDLELGTYGYVKAAGHMVLIGPDGKELWKGSFRARNRLVRPEDNLPPSVRLRRPMAIERLAEILGSRLPGHQN